MKNRYYISNVIHSDLWCIIDFRTRQVMYEGDADTCKNILKDLNNKAKYNIDLEKYLEGEKTHGSQE